MKKHFLKLLTVFIMFAIFFQGCGPDKSSDNSLKKIKNKGFFVVGLGDQFPPMAFRSPDKNDVIGFDIDLAKETAKRLGLKVQFKTIVWDNLITSLDSGEVDVIWSGCTITEEREKSIIFTKAYLNNRQIIVVRNDNTIKIQSDLKNKTIGLLRGSSSENALASNKSLAKEIKDIKKFDNNNLALIDLEAKRVDAVVMDIIMARWFMASKPGVFKILDDELGSELYGVALRKTDITFKNELDRVIDEIKNDQSGDEISKKWFGTNILLK